MLFIWSVSNQYTILQKCDRASLMTGRHGFQFIWDGNWNWCPFYNHFKSHKITWPYGSYLEFVNLVEGLSCFILTSDMSDVSGLWLNIKYLLRVILYTKWYELICYGNKNRKKIGFIFIQLCLIRVRLKCKGR